MYANTLIYDNTQAANLWHKPFDPNCPILDYGISGGGRVSCFAIRYQSALNIGAGTITVRFYGGADSESTGHLLKQFDLVNLPKGKQTYLHVLSQDERFDLPEGKFGYSFAFSNDTTYVSLASGGNGNEDAYWEYNTTRNDFQLLSFPNSHSGFYMQVHTGSPADPNTAEISGYVFHDANGNGIWDVDENTIGVNELFADINGNGLYEPYEPNSAADPNGFYRLTGLAAPAEYRIRLHPALGWTQTFPGEAENFEHVIQTEPNMISGPFNFGIKMFLPEYGGGEGTFESPYQIRTPAQLNQIGLSPADWDKHFILMADLDMNEIVADSYHRIGLYDPPDVYQPFTGSFNGNGHIIRNLSYANAWQGGAGLFGYLKDASVHDLGLANVNISTGSSFAGALAGRQADSTIQRCFAEGEVFAVSHAGGLVGKSLGGQISDCYARVRIDADPNSTYIGGFCGSSTSQIGFSYSTGAITAGPASDCVGGFVGCAIERNIVSCYWDTETSGQSQSACGTPKTTQEMYSAATYNPWDFEAVWRICEQSSYPRLQWEPVPMGDFVCPEGIDIMDMLFFAQEWLTTDDSPADLWPDGVVNLLDFAVFAELWMAGQ